MKKNLLTISLFIVFFSFVFCSSSFAASVDQITFPEIPLDSIDSSIYPYYKYVIFESNNGSEYGTDLNPSIHCFIYYSETPMDDLRFFVDGSGIVRVQYMNSTRKLYLKQAYLDGSEWVVKYDVSAPSGRYMIFKHTGTIYYSNDNIYSGMDNDDIFFQPTPLVKTLEEVIQETHLVAKEITQEAITAELVELVPVGVGILATIILVSLIAYWNFWKP